MTSSSENLPARAPGQSVGVTDGKFDPQNAAQLMEMARFIAKSELKPLGLKTAEDCFLVMFYGQAYGFHPAEALQCLFPVHGKVAADGQTMAGLIQSHPLCKDYRIWVEGEGDERAGCVQSWRKGRERANDIVRFTLAQARQAGLYPADRSSAWMKYTDDLLTWKAVARDKRRNWPDAHRKLDVLEDIEEVREVRNVTPPRAAPAGPDPLLAQLGAGVARTIDVPAAEPKLVDLPKGEDWLREQDEKGALERDESGSCGGEREEPSADGGTVPPLEKPVPPVSSSAEGSTPLEIPAPLRKRMKDRQKQLGLTDAAPALRQLESMVVDHLAEGTRHVDIAQAINAWKKPAP